MNLNNEKSIKKQKSSDINKSSDEESLVSSVFFENQIGNEKIKFSEEEVESDCQENSSSLLENIVTILEQLSTFYKKDQKLLFTILKEINLAINLLIKEFFSTSEKMNSKENEANHFFLTEEKNINKYNNERKKSDKLDINSKVVFLLKIEILNRKIASLNKEIKSLKTLLFKFDNQDKNNNFYKFVKKKFKEIKDKKKCDEFKYLLYIENQKKKIFDLEEKLKIKKNENLSKETLKSIRCFPNFIQYDFKEDINPKSIPLFQILHHRKDKETEKSIKNTKSKKHIINCLSVRNQNKVQIKPLIKSLNNTKSYSKKKFKGKALLINDKTKSIEDNNTLANTMQIKKNLKNCRDIDKNNSNKHLNFEKNLDIDNIKINNNYKTMNHEGKNAHNKFKINKKLVLEIKEFSPKTMINNKKEFFISHPTLNFAGFTKGKEQIYIGLPKNLLKFNKKGNINSTMMVFPSSLNETMVNLEKLRCNKLHVDISKKEDEK